MRDIRVDAFRGFLLITVILGHADYLPKLIQAIIYSFHMPAFFILSGYLYKSGNDGFLFFLKRKFKRLIVPAWILGGICSIPFVMNLLLDRMSLSEFMDKLFGTAIGYPSYSMTFNCTPLWFLFSIFMTEIIAYILLKLSRNNVLVLFFVGVIGLFLSQYYKSYTPFNVMISLSGLFFFSIGMNIRSTIRIDYFFGRGPVVVSLMLFFAVFMLFDINTNMAINTIGGGITLVFSVVCACIGTIVAFNISNFFVKFDMLKKYLSWVGVNTITMFAFDYYANNLVSFIFRYLDVTAYYYTNFILKVILLSIVAFYFSRVDFLDRLINGRLAKV